MTGGRGELPGTDLARVGSLFEIPGEYRSASRLGRGHIHDTYVATWEDRRTLRRVVHQRINTHVFPEPELVVATMARVVAHLRRKLAHLEEEALTRRVLTLVPARGGGFLARTDDGAFWRTTVFIPRSLSLESIADVGQAFRVAAAFGAFVRLLSDLPGPRLAETIPNFHDTPRHLAALAAAVERDPLNRAAGARDEIAFALARRDLAGAVQVALQRGLLPERVVHNDTKVNNVLLDESSGEALCVIDLDTVMPGTALYDFGDLVRSAVCATAEDERDPSRVDARIPVFEALVSGYLEGSCGHLTAAEIERFVTAAKVVTLECGVRFLADHLAGDRYFPARRSGHNLDRARVQFALVRSLERCEATLERIVERASRDKQ